MAFSKLSVTIPEELHEEIQDLARKGKTKLSHVVADALAEKVRKVKQEELLEKINRLHSDLEIADEQRSMAETIADNTDLAELPW